MKLSNRLQAVASFVTKGSRLADVGTDHGYIPIYLCENGMIERALAMDVNQGPLNRAQEHIKQHGMEKYIETRLSDGVKMLHKNEVDSVVIAGMGGGLIIKILEEGQEVLAEVNEIILQPQSEVEKVRAYVRMHGYRITHENMILEEGKYYPMFRIVQEQNACEAQENEQLLKLQDCFGAILLKEKNEVLIQQLSQKKEQYENIRQMLGKDQPRYQELTEELELIDQAFAYMERSE